MTALDEAIREAEECLRRRERIVPPTMDSREADALRNLLAAAKAPAPALPGVVQPDVVRAAAIVSERLRVYGDTSAYLYDCPGLVAEVTDLLDAIDSSPVACNAILADEPEPPAPEPISVPYTLPEAVVKAAEGYRRLRDGTGGVARLVEMRHQACRTADLVLSALDAAKGPR